MRSYERNCTATPKGKERAWLNSIFSLQFDEKNLRNVVFDLNAVKNAVALIKRIIFLHFYAAINLIMRDFRESALPASSWVFFPRSSSRQQPWNPNLRPCNARGKGWRDEGRSDGAWKIGRHSPEFEGVPPNRCSRINNSWRFRGRDATSRAGNKKRRGPVWPRWRARTDRRQKSVKEWSEKWMTVKTGSSVLTERNGKRKMPSIKRKCGRKT